MPNLNVGFLVVFCVTPVIAATLHYGTQTIYLDTVRRTNPALAIGMTGGTQYGALYPQNDAPAGALRVGDSWVGQNCAPGTYSSDGLSTCIDCGLGHYCAGGMHRAACTGGAIGCSGVRATGDVAAPAFANQFLTLDDVTAHVPPTDIGQWDRLSCCWHQGGADASDLNSINDINNACAGGIIGPGTYLFVMRYGASQNLPVGVIDALDGTTGSISNAYIAIFDHPVGYRSVHGGGIINHFIDTEHAPFESWTISNSNFLPDWRINTNQTNVTNITQQAVSDNTKDNIALCVFELK